MRTWPTLHRPQSDFANSLADYVANRPAQIRRLRVCLAWYVIYFREWISLFLV